MTIKYLIICSCNKFNYFENLEDAIKYSKNLKLNGDASTIYELREVFNSIDLPDYEVTNESQH